MKNEIEDMENDFIIRKGIKKLRPVDYDCACFDTIIIQNSTYDVKSDSQKNIKTARIIL